MTWFRNREGYDGSWKLSLPSLEIHVNKNREDIWIVSCKILKLRELLLSSKLEDALREAIELIYNRVIGWKNDLDSLNISYEDGYFDLDLDIDNLRNTLYPSVIGFPNSEKTISSSTFIPVDLELSEINPDLFEYDSISSSIFIKQTGKYSVSYSLTIDLLEMSKLTSQTRFAKSADGVSFQEVPGSSVYGFHDTELNGKFVAHFSGEISADQNTYIRLESNLLSSWGALKFVKGPGMVVLRKVI